MSAKKPFEIVNAKVPLQIEVTKSHVKRGVPNNPEECAFAIAAREYDAITEAAVYRTVVYLKRGGIWERYNKPAALRRETMVFDRHGEFFPGTYALTPVRPSHRRTGKRYGGKGKNGGKGGGSRSRQPPHYIPNIRVPAPAVPPS